jgi:6-pyruvoyltetrahydropterin/6-carboxytetrahydropterin synthase
MGAMTVDRLTRYATVRKEINISASHVLPLHPGKCRNEHGHNYKVEVLAHGEVDLTTGMVIDFYDMGKHLEMIVGRHDHAPLKLHEYYTDFPTTAENLANEWLEQLREIDRRYVMVRVWETNTCYAEAYLGGDGE